ncbi:MAG: hypothetical protein H6Q89_948 [Myxococcaceae bacterium]|nr:hypothetical protein [Myxococcaceae bacterium]
MLVKIEEIQDKGLELSEAVPVKLLAEALEPSEGFKVIEAGKITVRFKKVAGRVFLNGNMTAELIAPCKRCLKDVKLGVPVSFSLRMVDKTQFDRKPSAEDDDGGNAESAGSFDLDQADAEPFDGKTIDLDPIIREQVLLALPVSVLCREDCKGLCTVCGEDLNEKDCGCERKVVDVRLAALKDIKLN